METTKELLNKVVAQPGLCNAAEIRCVAEYLSSFQAQLDLFQNAFGYSPQGGTLTMMAKDLDYYVNKFSNQPSA